MSSHKKCIHCQQIARNKLKKQYCWQLLQIKWNSKVCILLKRYMIFILNITVSCKFSSVWNSSILPPKALDSGLTLGWSVQGMRCHELQTVTKAAGPWVVFTSDHSHMRVPPSKAPLKQPLSRKYQQPLVLRRMGSRQSAWLIKFLWNSWLFG